jgi:drug/metabolite transporter (DMT)-like permease
MYWFFIALAAPILWALVNIFDQYLVAKYSVGERTSGGLVLFGSFIGIIIAFLIGIFTANILQIPITDKLLLLAVGGITIAWVVLYLFALEIEDVSFVVPWFLTVPIYGFLLGYIILGETLTYRQLIGSFIILCGIFFTFIDFSSEKRKLKWKAGFYMAIACFLIAVAGVIFKYVAISNNFWISSFWEYVGFGLFGVMVYLFIPKYRNEFIAMIKTGGRKIIMINVLVETLTILGNLFNNFALLLAPVIMVYLVGSFQPVILLIFTVLITIFFPKIIIENISKNVLIPKIIAISITVMGSIILFL